jgi:PAS domain S-box-containing protein
MFVVICRPDGKIVGADTPFARAVGCRQSALPGRNLVEFLKVRRTFGQLCRGATVQARMTGHRKRESDVRLSFTTVPAGGATVVIVSGDRIAGRARRRESLPARQLLDSLDGAVLAEDRDGYITFANTRFLELTGYSLRQLVGRHWAEIVPPEVLASINQELHSRRRGRSSRYETMILTRSGRTLPVTVRARPIVRRHRYQGTVSLFTSPTEEEPVSRGSRARSARFELPDPELPEQREQLVSLTHRLERANAELRRLSDAKSDFVAAVSHDLRTPLTTIIGGISLVEDGTLGPVNPEQLHYLRLARTDAERLGEFINDILDLARIESGKVKPGRTRVNVAEQVAGVRRSYETLLHEKQLTLETEIPVNLPSVFCDDLHFLRILTNLLSNAIKFTPAGGRITIRAAVESPGLVQTAVEDTGIGIPRDQQSRVFGRFEQIERGGTFHQPGSGLGLSLCRQLVELNQGAIGFTSEEKQGSVFYFTLPVYPEILPFPGN